MIRTVSLWIRSNGKFSKPSYQDNKQTRLKPRTGNTTCAVREKRAFRYLVQSRCSNRRKFDGGLRTVRSLRLSHRINSFFLLFSPVTIGAPRSANRFIVSSDEFSWAPS